MDIKLCIDSSHKLEECKEMILMFENKIDTEGVRDNVELVISSCIGNFNKKGIAVQVCGKTYYGINASNFTEFWNLNIQDKI